MVPAGGRDGADTSIAISNIVVGALFIVRRARGHRNPTCATPGRRSSVKAIAKHGFPRFRRSAATGAGTIDYRATTAQWHADRAGRRSKPAKLAIDARLRDYVQHRLSGMIANPDGMPVSGPVVSWKGRRHGPRQDRRWATAWRPKQIARRLPIDFPDATKPSINRCMSRVGAHYAAI